MLKGLDKSLAKVLVSRKGEGGRIPQCHRGEEPDLRAPVLPIWPQRGLLVICQGRGLPLSTFGAERSNPRPSTEKERKKRSQTTTNGERRNDVWVDGGHFTSKTSMRGGPRKNWGLLQGRKGARSKY